MKSGSTIKNSILTAFTLFTATYALEPQFTTISLGTQCPTAYNISAEGSYQGSEYHLTGQGHDMNYGWDRGAYACLKVADSCTFILRIKKAPENVSNGKYGVCVREGLLGNERAIHLRYDTYAGNSCWTYLFRNIPGSISTEYCPDYSSYSCTREGKEPTLTSKENVYLRIEKAKYFYKLSVSNDKKNWTYLGQKGSLGRLEGQTNTYTPLTEDERFYLMSDTVYIGIALATGDQGRPISTIVCDSISIDKIAVPSTGNSQLKWPIAIPDWKAVAPNEHPRLFFRKTDLETLRKRAQTPEGALIMQTLKRQLGGGEAMPTVYNQEAPNNIIGNKRFALGTYTLWHGAGFGFLYQITSDTKYAELAKKCVDTAFAGQNDRDRRYNLKSPGAGLRAAPSLAAIAMAYDLCFDAWTPEYRKSIAQKILNYSATPVNNEGYEGAVTLKNMATSPRHQPGSNHYGCYIGGAGLCLLAINGDDGISSDSIPFYLSRVEQNVKRLMTEGFGDHGWFAEAQGPGNMPIASAMLNYFQALKVAAGKDFISSNPNVPWLSLRPLMEIIPRGNKPYIPARLFYDEGYGGEDFLGMDYFSNYVLQTHSGHFSQGFGAINDKEKRAFLWVYNKFVDQADTIPFNSSYYPNRAMLALVNWPFDSTPQNPAEVLPKVVQDKIKGYFAFRNRWQDENDIVVTALLGSDPFKAYSPLGNEAIKVWGLGIRAQFPGLFYQSATSFFEPYSDGSGVVSAVPITECKAEIIDGQVGYIPKPTAIVTSLGVDFSKKSGADALIVMTGPQAGRYPLTTTTSRTAVDSVIQGPNGSKAIIKTKIAADSTIYYLCMLLSSNTIPTISTNGSKLVVGGQTISFDKKRLYFESMTSPVQIAHTQNKSPLSMQIKRTNNKLSILYKIAPKDNATISFFSLDGKLLSRSIIESSSNDNIVSGQIQLNQNSQFANGRCAIVVLESKISGSKISRVIPTL